MKSIKITASGEVSVIDIKKYMDFWDLLGDCPEHVKPKRLIAPFCMVVDECGLLKNLPVNNFGSYLYQTDIHGSPIAGDIYIAKDVCSGGSYDTIGLDDSEIIAIAKQYPIYLLKLLEPAKV